MARPTVSYDLQSQLKEVADRISDDELRSESHERCLEEVLSVVEQVESNENEEIAQRFYDFVEHTQESKGLGQVSHSRCEVCGEDNPNALEEHHMFPRRFGGMDIEDNIILLCANCHRSIEKRYDNKFWSIVISQCALSDEYDDEPVSIGDVKSDFEKKMRVKIRYELIKDLANTGMSQIEIANFLERSEEIESLSQQRVGQIVNSECIEEVYNTFQD